MADPPPGKGKGHGKAGAGDAAVVNVNFVFSERDHVVVRDYYGGMFERGHCPPGLAKKNNGCLPPGQAKKLYNVGGRFPLGYGYAWNYNQIPYDLQRQYGFNPYDRYYYGDGYVYRVDPKTMLIQQVVSALLYR